MNTSDLPTKPAQQKDEPYQVYVTRNEYQTISTDHSHRVLPEKEIRLVPVPRPGEGISEIFPPGKLIPVGELVLLSGCPLEMIHEIESAAYMSPREWEQRESRYKTAVAACNTERNAVRGYYDKRIKELQETRDREVGKISEPKEHTFFEQ